MVDFLSHAQKTLMMSVYSDLFQIPNLQEYRNLPAQPVTSIGFANLLIDLILYYTKRLFILFHQIAFLCLHLLIFYDVYFAHQI